MMLRRFDIEWFEAVKIGSFSIVTVSAVVIVGITVVAVLSLP